MNWYDGLNLNLNVDGLRLGINVFDYVFILDSYFVSQLPSFISIVMQYLYATCNHQHNVIFCISAFI